MVAAMLVVGRSARLSSAAWPMRWRGVSEEGTPMDQRQAECCELGAIRWLDHRIC